MHIDRLPSEMRDKTMNWSEIGGTIARVSYVVQLEGMIGWIVAEGFPDFMV